MRVVISAAGTGGHIYPAISIINRIKQMNKEASFIYIGTTNRMEKDIIPKLGIKYIGLDVEGMSKNPIQVVKSLAKMVKANKKCKHLMQEFKPDIVIGVGGYVTVPVIYTAHRLGIKTLIHEQNSIPGKANIFLNKYVDIICTSIKNSGKYFDESKVVFTGNPRAEELLMTKKKTKKELGFDTNKKLVLITMGSLGSATVNEMIYNCFEQMNNKKYDVLFITGDKYYEKYKNCKYKNIKIVKYIDNMADILQITDVIISRAGATICSEITAVGIPSILIPSPYVPNNHQYLNAMEFVNNNATILIQERELDSKVLINAIDSLFDDQDKYFKMKQNAKKMGTPNSLSNIYKEIKKLIG